MTQKIHMQTDVARQHLNAMREYTAEAKTSMDRLFKEIVTFITEGWWALGANEFSRYCDDWKQRRINILNEIDDLAQMLEKEILQMEETGRALGG